MLNWEGTKSRSVHGDVADCHSILYARVKIQVKGISGQSDTPVATLFCPNLCLSSIPRGKYATLSDVNVQIRSTWKYERVVTVRIPGGSLSSGAKAAIFVYAEASRHRDLPMNMVNHKFSLGKTVHALN